MGFLSFLGAASAIAYGIVSESKSSSYKANKEHFLQSVNYDVDVDRDFVDICHVCGVRKEKINTLFGIQCNNDPDIWPKEGYLKCIPFLKEQPKLTDDDIVLFIKIYNEQRNIGLRKLQQKKDKTYINSKRGFKRKEVPNDLTIFEKNHLGGLSVDVHQKIVNDIYHNTFWNEIATGPAKILNDGKRREIWQVKNYGKIPLNNYYNACKNKCGYNKHML